MFENGCPLAKIAHIKLQEEKKYPCGNYKAIAILLQL